MALPARSNQDISPHLKSSRYGGVPRTPAGDDALRIAHSIRPLRRQRKLDRLGCADFGLSVVCCMVAAAAGHLLASSVNAAKWA